MAGLDHGHPDQEEFAGEPANDDDQLEVPRATSSHIGIIRPFAALWHRPVDVLRRILDVAGFAVDAVLGVDLKARRLALLPTTS